MMEGVAVFISSCDLYAPILPIAVGAIRTYLGELGLPIYISCESLEEGPEGAKVLRAPTESWNVRLARVLQDVPEEIIVFFMDDHFLEAPVGGQDYVRDLTRAVGVLRDHPEVGAIHLCRGDVHDDVFSEWERLGWHDREHNPCKRAQLYIPVLWRRQFMMELAAEVGRLIGPGADAGRSGACEFEVLGTWLTSDKKTPIRGWQRNFPPNTPSKEFPQRFMVCREDVEPSGILTRRHGVSYGRFDNLGMMRDLCRRVGVDFDALPGIGAFVDGLPMFAEERRQRDAT